MRLTPTPAPTATPTPQPLVPLHRTLTYRLHVLNKLSDRDSAAAYRGDAGLPISEGRCLSAIGAFAPLSIVDLAQRANLTKGQASRAAQALVDQGLVRKTASPTDRRGVVLALTTRGQRACKRVMDVVARRNDEIFGVLSPAEREQFGAMLDRILAHIRPADAGPVTAETPGRAPAVPRGPLSPPAARISRIPRRP